MSDELQVKASAARNASRTLANITSEVKDRALREIADGLLANQAKILTANDRDIASGREKGLDESFLLGDLTVVGTLGGGELADIEIVYVPEPAGLTLLAVALLLLSAFVLTKRRGSGVFFAQSVELLKQFWVFLQTGS